MCCGVVVLQKAAAWFAEPQQTSDMLLPSADNARGWRAVSRRHESAVHEKPKALGSPQGCHNPEAAA